MSYAHQRLDDVCEIIMGQAPSGDTYNTESRGWPLIAGAGDFGEVYPEGDVPGLIQMAITISKLSVTDRMKSDIFGMKVGGAKEK